MLLFVASKNSLELDNLLINALVLSSANEFLISWAFSSFPPVLIRLNISYLTLLGVSGSIIWFRCQNMIFMVITHFPKHTPQYKLVVAKSITIYSSLILLKSQNYVLV